jgi:hypothetical protein
MSTRARFGILYDGNVDSSYCHNDGYPAGLGKALKENYKTVEDVSDLIEMGDASSIKETIEDSVFYCRDRGEKRFDTAPYSEKLSSYLEDYSDSEYLYLFDTDKEGWICYKVNSGAPQLIEI